MSPRRRSIAAHDLIASPAFIVIKAADEFKDKTTAPNQLWQTDFTYLKVIGWGWFYLSTVLDDYSRFIIAWKLCTTMKAKDVSDTLTMALRVSSLDAARVSHRPRLLSDNGSSYIAGNLAEWLKDNGFDHIRGAPLHPQTQGKIERWHQTLKNRILLENYYLPGDSKPGSATSSRIIIICDTTRASPISPRPTSTSGEAKPSCLNEKGSNDRPFRIDVFTIAARPHNITQQMRQILLSISPQIVPNVLTTDTRL